MDLRSLSEWRAFQASHPEVLDARYIDGVVAYGQQFGLHHGLMGRIPPGKVKVHGKNYREEYHGGGFNARQRAILETLFEETKNLNPKTARIYAHEGLGSFAQYLRNRYPCFVGSEYALDEKAAARLGAVLHVDIADSPFPDAYFDIILSNDVLEHVPDLAASLTDSVRILKPGGVLAATFPFGYPVERTNVKAIIREDGAIEHFTPPEYHGNPVNAEGSLVFQIPGWDILTLCRKCGFKDAAMRFWSSHAHGFTGQELAGVFILIART